MAPANSSLIATEIWGMTEGEQHDENRIGRSLPRLQALQDLVDGLQQGVLSFA